MERLTLAYYYVREMVKEWLLKAGKEAEALLDKLDLEEEQAAEMPPPLCVPVKLSMPSFASFLLTRTFTPRSQLLLLSRKKAEVDLWFYQFA